MKVKKIFLVLASLSVAACAQQDNPVDTQLGISPQLTQNVQDKGKPQTIACRPKDLKAVQKGKIKANGCLYGTDQREDLYRVDQLALGLPDLSGSHMLTFTSDAGFDGIFGVSHWDETVFGSLVYGYTTFSSGDVQSFSVIGSAPEYKLFFSGIDGTQLGKYTLTTTVENSENRCAAGHLVFIQGSVSFSSTIDNANACDGTVTVGPYAGNPLKYQYWYAKLEQGQQATLSIDGVNPDSPAVTLAVIVWGSSGPLFSQLDFADGSGHDTDRSITFTAPMTAYYYLEVSTYPGQASPYHLAFTSD